MTDRGNLAFAILAAGASRRFGEADKLSAEFRGKMLGLAVCQAIPRALFVHRYVISSRADHPCALGWGEAGYQVLVNAQSDEGMGTSVAMAATQAEAAGADALMIALADMPCVPGEHFEALANAECAANRILVSSDGESPMPPAIFGSDHFGALAGLSGDKGARGLLSAGAIVPCPKKWLVDIDTPEALASLNRSNEGSG